MMDLLLETKTGGPEKDLPQCRFSHHTSHMDYRRVNSGTLPVEAIDQVLQSWSFVLKNCDLEYVLPVMEDRGGTVVKVLCYKSEGRWSDSRWCHWNFSLT